MLTVSQGAGAAGAAGAAGESSALNAWRLFLGMPMLLLSSAGLAQWLSTLSSHWDDEELRCFP